MMKTLGFLLSLGLVFMTTQVANGQLLSRGCTDQGCEANASCCNTPSSCPNCHAKCIFEAKTVSVEKKCYEVECKPICVPRVRFPWQKCCEPVCADVKYVKVLKVKKYECEECEYSWKIDESPCSCGSCESMWTPTESGVPVPANEEPAKEEQAAENANGAAYNSTINFTHRQGNLNIRRLPSAQPIRQVSDSQTIANSRFQPVVVRQAQNRERAQAPSNRRQNDHR